QPHELVFLWSDRAWHKQGHIREPAMSQPSEGGIVQLPTAGQGVPTGFLRQRSLRRNLDPAPDNKAHEQYQQQDYSFPVHALSSDRSSQAAIRRPAIWWLTAARHASDDDPQLAMDFPSCPQNAGDIDSDAEAEPECCLKCFAEGRTRRE